MKTVRVESRRFTATFRSDGIIREAEKPLTFMIGWPDDKVRAVIKKNKWRAIVTAGADVEDVRRLEPEPERRKDADYQPMVFRCEVCGKEACFGYGVALLKDRIGTWYCRAHKPGAAGADRHE